MADQLPEKGAFMEAVAGLVERECIGMQSHDVIAALMTVAMSNAFACNWTAEEFKSFLDGLPPAIADFWLKARHFSDHGTGHA